MSKKLNIIEAMKMPIGTKFNLLLSNGNITNNTVSFVERDHGKILVSEIGVLLPARQMYLEATFIPIEQSVSFTEVVDSDKKCRVEHEFIESIKKNNQAETVYNSEFKKGEYLPLNYLMCILGGSSTESNIKEIIKEGKWYLEDKVDE